MSASARVTESASSIAAAPVLPLEDLVGIRPDVLHQIQRAGILTVESLIANAHSPRLRMFLSERTGLTARQILDVLNMADLTRVSGLTQANAMLLRSFGIRNVTELAAADCDAILEALSADEDIPREEMFEISSLLSRWIAQARETPRLVD
jgi:predicted RecB family nuclease